jgi:hypothetical protein
MAGLMPRIGRVGLAGVLLSAALLAFCFACYRSASIEGNSGAKMNDQSEQKVPFREETGTATSSPGMLMTQPVKDGPPFTNPPIHSLPAGTLVTVKLKNSLSSRGAAGERFSAVMDEPIVVDGEVIVGRGIDVSGRVESAQASPGTRSSNSFRLTLDSMTIRGKLCPLHTASLFAKATSGEAGKWPIVGISSTDGRQNVRLKKGRRLTFRLTEAAPLGG